jgi:hypothetical protein
MISLIVGDYGYVCFYAGKRVEVYASTMSEAKALAIKKLKVPAKKTHMVSVVLAEKPGPDGQETVTHVAVD